MRETVVPDLVAFCRNLLDVLRVGFHPYAAEEKRRLHLKLIERFKNKLCFIILPRRINRERDLLIRSIHTVNREFTFFSSQYIQFVFLNAGAHSRRGIDVFPVSAGIKRNRGDDGDRTKQRRNDPQQTFLFQYDNTHHSFPPSQYCCTLCDRSPKNHSAALSNHRNAASSCTFFRTTL